MTGRSRFDPGQRQDIFPLCPDQIWGPPSLLYNGYGGPFPGGEAQPGRDADHSPQRQCREWVGAIHPLPTFASIGVCGTALPLPFTLEWYSFTFTVIAYMCKSTDLFFDGPRRWSLHEANKGCNILWCTIYTMLAAYFEQNIMEAFAERRNNLFMLH
jgi:hypothetical protein